MAKVTNLDLTIRIGGKLDKSLTAALSGTHSALGSLTGTLSKIGDAGLKAMGALAKGTVKVIKDCTNAASQFESQMSDVVKYVGGLADETGKISDKIAANGKTYKENYDAARKSILETSAVVPYTAEDLTRLAASFGQSGKTQEQIFGENGYMLDAARVGAAWDISADLAGDYIGKWENSMNMNHEQVMELAELINYTGANKATTAAEIAEAVNLSASVGQVAGIDPKTTVAVTAAMLAAGVSTARTGTAAKNMYLGLMVGDTATKSQAAAIKKLGWEPTALAEAMVKNSTGTMLKVFNALKALPQAEQLSTIKSMFGRWPLEGIAKIVENLDVFTTNLGYANDSSLWSGSGNAEGVSSIDREFEIKNTTAEAAALMKENALNLLKVNIGEEFLPAKKNLDLAIRDLYLSINENIPSLKTLAGTLGDLAAGGVRKLTDALNKGVPYIERLCNYLANNGDQVVNTLGKVVATLVAMKFSPAIAGAATAVGGGLSSLLLGSTVGGSLAGGAKRVGGLAGLFRGGQAAAAGAGNALTAARTGTKIAMGNAAASGGGFLNTLSAALIGGSVGLGNTNKLTNARRSETWRNNNLAQVRNTITDIQEHGGIRGVLSKTGPGKYISGIGKGLKGVRDSTIGQGVRNAGGFFLRSERDYFSRAFGTVKNTLANSSIGSGAIGVLRGIHQSDMDVFRQYGDDFRTSRLGQWLPGAMQTASGAMSKVGGGIAKGAGAVAKGAGAAAQFAGAGANLIGAAWGPAAGFFGPLLSGALPVAAAITGVIAVVDMLGDHMDSVRSIVEQIFGDRGVQVFDTFTNKLSEIGTFITGLFREGGVADAVNNFRTMLAGALDGNANQEGFMTAFDGVVTIIQSIMTFVGQLVSFAQTTVRPAIESLFTFIVNTVVPMIVNIFNQAAPIIASILTNIGTVIMGAMTLIGTAIEAVWPVIQNLITTILSIAEVVIPIVLQAFDTFASGLTTVIDGAKTILDGLIQFVTGVFSGDWSQAWEGVKQIFKGVFDALEGLIKTPINAVIGVINNIIDRINGINVKIPDWIPVIGGKGFTLNIPHMAMLAKGGFTSGPSIAGEAGREAVISFDRSYRNANIATWMKAGRLLGMGSSLKEIPAETGGSNVSVQFAPSIQISGRANRADVEQALEQAMRMFESRFEQMYDRMERQRMRRAFA